MDELTALSVLDGRYAKLTGTLARVFSEYGLIRMRVYVELQWLKFLGRELALFELSDADVKKIDAIAESFDANEARSVKSIEKTTNHDVKAVEYYIKTQLDSAGLSAIREWTHFACTSEDINNTAYALMIRQGRDEIADGFAAVLSNIEALAREHKAVPMMSRTHGQPATPTTVGKEFVNFAWRLRRELEKLKAAEIHGKVNGASGNFNAHAVVFPDIDWIDASHRFVSEYLLAVPLLWTTQINPYSYIAELLQVMNRGAAILIDLDRDMWGYISFGYFKQKLKEGEVGSSTMPHKVNPIDFENSEGNLGIAISLMEHLSVKLLQSRFQRDLSDSTVLRNLGAVFGYVMIGLKNALKGLNKIDINIELINEDLTANPALLAEPIQTVMRVFGEADPYEKLKALTRGKSITNDDFITLIDSLQKVPPEYKERLKTLTCDTYTGKAEELVKLYFEEY
ncbi:MAG: adenylosuccinate lyase [Thermodesulfobacteriota bacterium]|nr:adenylosuccinate lyase [Thermodesulfobacteriota bacterium]